MSDAEKASRAPRTIARCIALSAAAVGALGGMSVATADDTTLETVVVTATRFNPDTAPAKSSLETTQPQTIINRSYIEEFVAPQADYVTILAIAPSLTGTDINGPGLSEGSVKNTLRGLPDGNFGMSYDGVPFGDTNGPSHHSLSYFPGSTIGSILVDRGPGNAGTLGAATYGGTISMYSEPLSSQRHIKGLLSFGAFKTRVMNVNAQSGTFGDGTRVMGNFQNTRTDGALSGQDVYANNGLIKAEHSFSPDWKLTLFANYGFLKEHLNDNNGATPAQIATYGADFALQKTNTALPTFNNYNLTTKATDLDYLHLEGSVSERVKIDDKAYTYGYWNHTFTATNVEQTLADIQGGTAQGMGGKSAPIVGGVARPTDIPGYTKQNAFRVWGNILRLSEDFQFGSVTGQAREGVWWEAQYTHRFRYDYDSNLCFQQGVNPFDHGNITGCQDSSLAAKGKAVKTALGYAEYEERTSWNQVQPFVELELHPISGLTVTPGLKYVRWLHSTDAAVEPKLLAPYAGSFTTTKSLPFLEANYKVRPSWSVYAQYAQGIYVPDITAFEQKTPVITFPEAQTTTNYQLGTVFYADNFTVDGDVYYIPIKNNIVSENCALIGGPAGDTCFVNTGTATYQGIEGEATYAFNQESLGPLNGLVAFLNGSVMSAKSDGLWLKQAPRYTVAGGLMYKHGDWKFSLIDKTVGPQYQDNTQNPNYALGSYGSVDAVVGFTSGKIELSAGLNNAANSRKVVSIAENDSTYQVNRLASTDQYYYQAPRSLMVTLKARL
jgi:iron complex outermembrane receptor protein